MLPVYICDDEEKMRKILSDEIARQILIGGHDMQTVLCTGDPEELLDMARQKQKRGIYFLDVDLKQKRSERDGFWVGREIRKFDPRGFIIYITSFRDLAFKTFQYHVDALDYIVKDDILKMLPAIRDCLRVIAKRMLEEMDAETSAAPYFTVKMADSLRHIPLAEIICFETSPRTHRILLYTESERLDFIGKLSEIEEQAGNNFIRCHRAFLVNREKIRSVDLKNNEITMQNGQICLVSRSMKPKLAEICRL